jgi:UDP-glucose 4-epimerase
MVIPRFISAAIRNETLRVFGSGAQSRCFCHVYDAIKGVLAVIDSEKTLGEVFNIGNDFEITIQDLAVKIVRQLGSESNIENVTYENAYASGFEDLQKRVPDLSKIKGDVGWFPSLSLDSIISDVASDINP